jgi:hypothetical protein
MINKKRVAELLIEIDESWSTDHRKDNFYASDQSPKGFVEFREETYKPLRYAHDESLFIGDISTNKIGANQDIECFLINSYEGLTEDGKIFIRKYR